MYKVWVLNDNKVENIFVFNGKDKEDPFSEADKRLIEKDKLPKSSIIESPVQIHKDDSILQIKKKILNEFGKESHLKMTAFDIANTSAVSFFANPCSIPS
jgi:hypothetical protein